MNAWRDAALGVGENLSTIGPDHYYDFDVVTWTSWAISQVRGLNAEIAASRAERDRLKAANAEMLKALKNLLAWANIQDTHSSQAVELRNAARAAIKNSEAL